jgi:carbonic anhydrase
LLSGALMMLLTRQANAANTDYSQNGANWADVTT